MFLFSFFFQTSILQKRTVGFCVIRTWIVGTEGKHTNHPPPPPRPIFISDFFNIFVLMAGFELGSSGIGSNRSVNYATTTALPFFSKAIIGNYAIKLAPFLMTQVGCFHFHSSYNRYLIYCQFSF